MTHTAHANLHVSLTNHSDFYSTLSELDRLRVTELQPLMVQYLSTDAEQALCTLWDALQAQASPQVLLLANYNSGKTLLCQTLTNSDCGEVADIPKTDRVDGYPWAGVTLLDSPGLNAPMDHQAITEAQLARATLILALIREGDHDSHCVYERLMPPLAEGKPIFVVFNHQLPQDEQQACERQIRAQFVRYAENYAEHHAVETEWLDRVNSLPLFSVNLGSAHKAIRQGKTALLPHTGWLPLAEGLQTWLSGIDAQQQCVKGSQQLLLADGIQPLLAVLPDIPTLHAQQQAEQQRQDEENNTHQLNHLWLYQQSERCLRQGLQAQRKRMTDLVQQRLHGRMAADTMATGLQHILSDLLVTLQDTLTQQVASHQASIEAALSMPDIDQLDTHSNSALQQSLRSGVKKGLKNLDEKALLTVLKTGRQWKLPILKGRWEKTLGKWAGRAAPMISIATGLWEVASAHSEQEKANQREHDAAISEQTALVDTQTALETAARGVLTEWLEGLPAPETDVSASERVTQQLADRQTCERLHKAVMATTVK